MLTTAKLCAILLAGATVGSVSTVAVQKARPVAAKAIKHPSKKIAPRPQAHKAKPAPFVAARSNIQIMDCAITGSAWADVPANSLPLVPMSGGVSSRPFPPVWPVEGGGGGIAPSPPPTVSPGIPEPDAWALGIIGFGLVGASMRRRGERELAK